MTDGLAGARLSELFDAAGLTYPIILTVRQNGDTLTPVFGPEATAQQQADAAAILAAFDAEASEVTSNRVAAKTLYDDAPAEPRLLRAIVAAVVSELNILRRLHGLAPRTASQVRTAIRNNVDADS